MFAWLRFTKEVTLGGASGPEQFLADVAEVTATPFSTRKGERMKPLRGRLSGESGVLRWPINRYQMISPRSLHFSVQRVEAGTLLTGQFRLWLGFRVVVISWLGIGAAFWLVRIVDGVLFYHAGWALVWQGVRDTLIGAFFAYGYTWICVAVGRRREKQMVAVLRNVLAGSLQAGVVKDLLSA